MRRKAATEWFYHPRRLHFPMKRAGARGERKWRRIPWEQALDEIAEKLAGIKERYGPEALATTRGTLRTHEEYRSRFLNLFGSPNQLGHSRICMGSRSAMGDLIAGRFSNFAIRQSTSCIVLLGAEPLVSRPQVAKTLREAKARGGKLIVLDPRETRSAQMADVWLRLRPGTDAAVLLGMINVIIADKLYDEEFVSQWCHGFEQLQERAREYPPGVVAGIAVVPAEQIVAAARLYATNRPGTFIEGMGVEHNFNAAPTLHARWILAAMANNIDVEGGEEQAPPSSIITNREIELAERMSPAQWLYLGISLLLSKAGEYPGLVGIGFLAYTLGLRHAFDADHIAAIDNTVRKMAQQEGDPTGVGFFFSLGHSTVVFIMAMITAVSVLWAQQTFCN